MSYYKHNARPCVYIIIYAQHCVVNGNFTHKVAYMENKMEFGEKIRNARAQCGLSQNGLAEKSGLSLRSIQNYESGQRHPANISIVKNIASALGVSYEYLLDDKAQYVLDAAQKGGESAATDIDRLLSDLQGLFAGGTLSQKDRDKVMKAVNEIYWETKVN